MNSAIARASARDTIEIYLPGATEQQAAEMQRQLYSRFNPAFEVPATRFLPDVLDSREGGHNSTLPV